MSRKRTGLLAAAAAVIVGASAGGAVVFGGVYDVGATAGHARPIELVLRRTMESSVKRHAGRISVPDNIDLTDTAYAAGYFGHYDAACATCHGAPGRQPDPWMVLYPSSPLLTDSAVASRWSDEELFWILKHGIKDTGMMALGPTHSDSDIWGVTAFVRQLARMTPEQYDALALQQLQEQRESAPDHH